MKTTKKILSILLALLMITSIIPMSTITAIAEETATSGTCGENLTWDFDESTGTLTISGEGEMEDYSYSGTLSPWCSLGQSITSIMIESGVTSIGDFAFSNFSSLASITIPDSITKIGNYSFYLCPRLTSIVLPGTVKTIEPHAFDYCSSLKTITIPDSVTTIGNYVFLNCYSLTNVTVDSNNQCYSSDEYGVLFNKDKTTLIQYPIGNTRRNYTISDIVTSIDSYAFAGCANLTSVIIPNSVTTIDTCAFFLCSALKDVYYCGTEEEWNAITIGNYNDELLNATIHFNSDGEHEHNYTTVFVEATCTEGGYTRYTCECGDTFISDATEALGHDFSVIISSTAGNCQEGGIITYVCANGCGETLTIQTEAGSHQLVYEEAKSPTCTEGGYTAREYCEVCDYSSGGEYVPALGHTVTTIVLTTATCKQQGMQYDYCEECGETLSDIVYTAKKDHVLGEWEITVEATSTTNGEKVQKCTVCGDVINRGTIPATGNNESGNDKVVDDETGVELEYPKNKYDGDVDITVEETVDETAFNLVDTKTDASNVKLYNIKMTVDGVETQPNGKVTVRIPLPAGFNPDTSYIIHIDTTTGTVEKINTTYENGYLIFETTHFSYYAVVEEGNYTFSIQSPSRTEIRNKDGIILHANVDGTAPNGSYVRWESSNGNFDKNADGSNLRIVAKNKGWTTFTAILCDADGNELARDTVDMYSKSGFFDKIGGFFRSLFGTTKVYEN